MQTWSGLETVHWETEWQVPISSANQVQAVIVSEEGQVKLVGHENVLRSNGESGNESPTQLPTARVLRWSSQSPPTFDRQNILL